MQKRAPTLGNMLVIILFVLSCFGLLLFLWESFGGPLPLKAKGYRIVHMVPGPGSGPTSPAPKGWVSETERVIGALKPRLEKSAIRLGGGPIPVRRAPRE